MARLKVVTAALALAALLNGCVDVKEEIWLQPDGVTRLKLQIGISETAAAVAVGAGQADPIETVRHDLEGARDALQEDRRTRSVTLDESTIGGDRQFELNAVVSRPEALAVAGESLSLRLEPLGHRQFKLTQTFGEPDRGGDAIQVGFPAAESPSSLLEWLAEAVKLGLLGDHAVNIRLHAPRVVSSNGAVDEARTTAQWQYPLVDLLEGDELTRLEAVVQMPFRPWPWVLGGLGLLFLAALLVTWRARRSERGCNGLNENVIT